MAKLTTKTEDDDDMMRPIFDAAPPPRGEEPGDGPARGHQRHVLRQAVMLVRAEAAASECERA